MARKILLPLVLIVACVALFLWQRSSRMQMVSRIAAEREIAEERARNAELRDKLTGVEQERDKLQKEAAEVHRLRAEISTLRAANQSLEKKAAAPRAAAPAAPAAEEKPAEVKPRAAAFGSYAEMGKYVGGLRAKAFGNGTLTPQERLYLQSLKPELEKLEHSPAEFAAFQSELIQSAAGITDPTKTEQIRETIQKVYENAVSRGLDLPARPADDLQWVEDRFRLDRRGTEAIQGMLTDEERTAFDRQFIGIMGVDLGVGVDKTAYPKDFLGDPAAESK